MNLDELKPEVKTPAKAKATPKKVDEGYVKALEQLLDETELKLPKAFDMIGWRNCI